MSDILSAHALSHVISELCDWELDDPDGHELSTGQIHAQLVDSGYGNVVENGILEQVVAAWQRHKSHETVAVPRWAWRRIIERLQTVAEDENIVSNLRRVVARDGADMLIDGFGEGWVKIADIENDPDHSAGINLGIGHHYTEGVWLAFSPDEIREFIKRLQTSIDRLDPPDGSELAMTVFDAWGRLDIEEQREVMANMVEAMVQSVGDVSVPEVCHDLANDALAIQGDVRR
jgi:hypothetical protein